MNELFPLAEHFHSVQGEGYWVGTPMHFLRLPGCSVGSKATADWIRFPNSANVIPILQNGARGSKCQTYDGRFFDCDTDFHKALSKPLDVLIEETYEGHICLTGGEPLNHAKQPYFKGLFDLAQLKGIQIHVETSGTIWDDSVFGDVSVWTAVAPKAGYLKPCIDFANEIKLLVDDLFDVREIPEGLRNRENVFISPINFEKHVDSVNLAHCLDILVRYPNWRLSAQWHKFLGVR